MGCRIERSRQWAVRCKHEASMHDENCFITLTFDDAHLPFRGSLSYEPFQRFLKRLRKSVAPCQVRFFMCGEYGEVTFRPHFHALLFGFDFPDKRLRQKRGKYRVYESEMLSRLWPFGRHEIGDMSFESAQYVAKYCTKKEYGKDDDPRVIAKYGRVDPDTGEFYMLEREFSQCSLKPGIGATWYAKFASDVNNFDVVVVNGQPSKPPRYYDKLRRRVDREGYEAAKDLRQLEAMPRRSDNIDSRLSVKDVVLRKKLAFFKRKGDL